MFAVVAGSCSRATSAPEAGNFSLAVVDDYAGVSVPGREWYCSRIGTDRGTMGDGVYRADLGGGKATFTLSSYVARSLRKTKYTARGASAETVQPGE